MGIIHYLIFLPVALISSIYVKFKLNQIFKVKKRLSNFLYYFIILIVFYISFTNLSFFTVFLGYTSLFYLLFDIVFFILKNCNFNSFFHILKNCYLKGLTVFILAFLVTCYGIYNAEHLVVNHYNFNVNKLLKQNYKIALISDLHLGTGTYRKDLKFIVDNINKEDVDLFVMTGDIFDEATNEEEKNEFYEALKKINTRFGIFAIEGNHDVFKTSVVNSLLKCGVNILNDTTYIVNDDFYLVGRKDKIEKRAPIGELIKNINKTRTIILLDHRPVDVLKASKIVDIQLSGHTHKGQLWPGNFFVISGIHHINNYTLFTTSGIGTWGVPIRTSGNSELAIINLKGKYNYDILANKN